MRATRSPFRVSFGLVNSSGLALGCTIFLLQLLLQLVQLVQPEGEEFVLKREDGGVRGRGGGGGS